MKNVLFLFLFTVIIFGCSESKLIVDTSNSKFNLDFRHYEQDLFNVKTGSLTTLLDSLARKYPVFISGNYKDPAKLMQLNQYLNNDLNIKLHNDWNERIGDYSAVKADLNMAFSHYVYYFPEDSIPPIYTYISGLNYEEPIVINPKAILIGIDLFYGKDYPPYGQLQIPQYISKNHETEFITPIVMREFAKQRFAPYLKGDNMLETMIGLGKIEYLIEAMMPTIMDSTRFQFTTKQMVWCYSHEQSFWKHLTMKNFLFSKDYHTYKRFLQHGPFVSSMERDSPGRAGIFIGYRIVKDFMEQNPEVSLPELMTNTDFTSIFKRSKYNP